MAFMARSMRLRPSPATPWGDSGAALADALRAHAEKLLAPP
jgi:hypothetical protein